MRWSHILLLATERGTKMDKAAEILELMNKIHHRTTEEPISDRDAFWRLDRALAAAVEWVNFVRKNPQALHYPAEKLEYIFHLLKGGKVVKNG